MKIFWTFPTGAEIRGIKALTAFGFSQKTGTEAKKKLII